jgi:glutathione S-transferase
MKIYYSNPSSWLSNTVKVAANCSGETFELVKITNDQKEEYKKNQNPSGFFPYLEINETGISETHAILRYIARLYPDAELYGKSTFQRAKIDEIMDYCVSNMIKNFGGVYNILGHFPLTKEAYKTSNDNFKIFCKKLNALIKGKEFLVGDSITIADIRIVCNLVYPFRI